MGVPPNTERGGPLGSLGPYLDLFPGVWPTKEELKGEAWLGEDPPPPVAHDNYSTAELFAKEIESTFYEERALDMVDGPFTRSEAAERCRCKPEELCPGPLAGIDESDKIRTIYDGSKGGANKGPDRGRRMMETSGGLDVSPRSTPSGKGPLPGAEGPDRRAPSQPVQARNALGGAGGNP